MGKTIFKEILKHIANGILTIQELSTKTGISENTIKTILNILEKKGYLRKINCDNILCQSCILNKTCPYISKQVKVKIYILTEKGLEATKSNIM